MAETVDNLNASSCRAASPLVTIAIPTYNRADFLQQAIESALGQCYPSIEVVVSDNDSSDATPALLSGYTDSRLRHVRQQTNIGMVANWNACLELAQGEYFILLSDDDRLAPDAIRDMMDAFDGSADVPAGGIAFVYGCCEIHNTQANKRSLSQSAPRFESSQEYRINYLRSRRVSYPSATLYRTRDIRAMGGYSTRYGYTTDIGMAFETSARYPTVAFTRSVTTYYLYHPENLTKSSSIDFLLSSTRELAKLCIDLLGKTDQDYRDKTLQAGAWAQASALTQLVAERYFCNSIGFGYAVRKLWESRELFRNGECLVLLGKVCIKLSLCGLFGWRRLPPAATDGRSA